MPIPACKGSSGGCCGDTCGPSFGLEASDYQFPPPGRDTSRNGTNKPRWHPLWEPLWQRDDWLGGFGMGGGCDYDTKTTRDIYFSFVVIDEVVVPNLPAGEYIMSWRWDVEQGWSSERCRICLLRLHLSSTCQPRMSVVAVAFCTWVGVL